MPYEKTQWLDHSEEFPDRYVETENEDGTITHEKSPGEIYQEGTPTNAANMNKIEQGIFDAYDKADKALPKSGGVMDNELLVQKLNADLLDGKHATDFAGKTHAHGNITNDGKIGTEADRFLVTGTGGAVGGKTKQEAVDLIGVTNPNILHNWDFNRPINQRETPAGAIASSGYFYDRWRAGVGVIVEENGYVTVPVDVNLQQRIEGIEHAGKTYTYTCEDEAGVYRSVVVEFPTLANPNYKDYNVDGLRVRTSLLPDQVSGVYLHLTPQDSSITFVRHKLELGTVSTLAYDPPMDWAVEELKCKRFYQNLTGYYPIGYVISGKAYFINHIKFVPLLRVVPTYQITHLYMGGVGNLSPSQRNALLTLDDEGVISLSFNQSTAINANNYVNFTASFNADL